MASSDLKGDFGGWLDSSINDLQKVIDDIDNGGDWTTPKATYVQRQFALIQARCELWEVVAR